MKKCFAIIGLSLLLFACDSGNSASALRGDMSVPDAGNGSLSADVDEDTQTTDADERVPYGESEGVANQEKPVVKSSSSMQISSSSEGSKLKKLNVVDFVPEGDVVAFDEFVGSDSLDISTVDLEKYTDQFGIDSLAFDERVKSYAVSFAFVTKRKLNPYYDDVYKLVGMNKYSPLLLNVPDSLLGYFFPSDAAELEKQKCMDCTYKVLVVTHSDPFAAVITDVTDGVVSYLNISPKPVGDSLCYSYNDVRLAAFLIEQNGDTAVPDDKWYITYETKEAVTWTCGKN